jgi:hypothetical protein
VDGLDTVVAKINILVKITSARSLPRTKWAFTSIIHILVWKATNRWQGKLNPVPGSKPEPNIGYPDRSVRGFTQTL